VLNGSRHDPLRGIDRRLRGLAGGQDALVLVAGVSGTSKSSQVTACRPRMEQLGLAFVVVDCS
jgi:predicted AAA+ superfamily ATPase